LLRIENIERSLQVYTHCFTPTYIYISSFLHYLSFITMTLGDEPIPLTGEGAGASSSFPSPSSSEESFVPGNRGQLLPETPHILDHVQYPGMN
jgi:hypothetical protein